MDTNVVIVTQLILLVIGSSTATVLPRTVSIHTHKLLISTTADCYLRLGERIHQMGFPD